MHAVQFEVEVHSEHPTEHFVQVYVIDVGLDLNKKKFVLHLVQNDEPFIDSQVAQFVEHFTGCKILVFSKFDLKEKIG